MAKIIGIVEPLKSLKAKLKSRGISRFKSIKEIKDFQSNYDFEKNEILHYVSKELEKNFSKTSESLEQNNIEKNNIVYFETNKLNKRIVKYNELIFFIKNNGNGNFINYVISRIKLYITIKRLNDITKNKSSLINSTVKHLTTQIEIDEDFINKYNTNKNLLVKDKAKPEIGYLKYTRNVINDCNNLIAGAIGESMVVKEIEKLSDDYVLINDFNLSFSRPIFYKKQNQRIYSIQIDHLLISKAGIFIIETKNWSKSSVNSLNLRSPIEQIERSNFGLHKYLSENITLNEHHWGEQIIPIRNLIVMINNKPNVNFKYVKIKLLREMNNYIKYFDPVLTENQINRIVNNLN